MVDWNQAFDRQCPQLAVQSFVDNGVRKSLIPILINYFQDRKMYVKWKNILSTMRDLPGGGPQGCPLGLQSYLSPSHSIMRKEGNVNFHTGYKIKKGNTLR